jgi:hypothetical protein
VTRFLITLNSQKDRAVARQAIDRAPPGYIADIRESSRTLEQNRALYGLLNQIQRQRPIHNGVRMDAELWKATFLQALGVEMKMLPTLDGDGFFPVGHRSSQLTKSQFTALLELMLAWTAREGIEIKHFDDHNQGSGGGNVSRGVAA